MKTTTSQGTFSFRRMLLLARRFGMIHRRTWLMGFAAVSGFLLLSWLITHQFFSATPAVFGSGWNIMVLYLLGGWILTSTLYSELHSPLTAFQLHTLPVTRVETVLAGWLTGAFLYTFAAFALMFILSMITAAISAVTLESWDAFVLFNPFNADVLGTVRFYLVTQSVFLLGAIFFRGRNFLKTVMAVVLLFFGGIALAGITAYVMHLAAGLDTVTVLFQNGVVQIPGSKTVNGFVQDLLWIFFIALMLVFSLNRLKYRQVT